MFSLGRALHGRTEVTKFIETEQGRVVVDGYEVQSVCFAWMRTCKPEKPMDPETRSVEASKTSQSQAGLPYLMFSENLNPFPQAIMHIQVGQTVLGSQSSCLDWRAASLVEASLCVGIY